MGRVVGALAPPSRAGSLQKDRGGHKDGDLYMTTIDHRGRDLAIIPNDAMLRLQTLELLQTLFGSHLPADIRAAIGHDKRHAFLRTLPMHFQAIKQALRAQGTPFDVAFEERPVLPFATTLQVEPRPYQREALSGWLAEGSAG